MLVISIISVATHRCVRRYVARYAAGCIAVWVALGHAKLYMRVGAAISIVIAAGGVSLVQVFNTLLHLGIADIFFAVVMDDVYNHRKHHWVTALY